MSSVFARATSFVIFDLDNHISFARNLFRPIAPDEEFAGHRYVVAKGVLENILLGYWM